MSGFVSYDIETETLFDDEGCEYEGAEFWLIAKVWVPLNQRGHGKARRMLTEAIADMKAARPGLPIRLWCEPQDAATDGERLAAFYDSLGFSATGNGAEMEL